MQHCTACGTAIPDNARFCRYCGHTLNPDNVDTIRVNPGKKRRGQTLNDLALVSTHPLPDTSVKEQEIAAPAVVPTPSTDTSREVQPIDEIPTSALSDPAISDIPTSTLPHPDSSESEETIQDEDVSVPASSPAEPSSSPVQSPPASTAKRTSRPLVKWLMLALACLLVLAVGVSAFAFFARGASPNPAGRVTPVPAITPTTPLLRTPIASVTPISVRGAKADLTFSGAVSGHMTGINVVSCGAGASVAGNTQYHLGLFGTVSGKQYAFAFNIYPYTHPDTYTTTVFSFFGPAGENSSIAQWHSGPTSGVSVTINNNGKSGTLNIAYVNTADKSTAQVVGNWTCG